MAAAVGSLLIGAVAFWTTARISGLEDYLKSEIERRNAELNDISAQGSELRRKSEVSSEQLSRMQADTNTLLSSSVIAQRQYLAAEAELARVRAQTLSAQVELQDTRSKRDRATESLEEQSREYDLAKRRHTFQLVTLGVYSQMTWLGVGPADPLTGRRLITTIAGLRPPAQSEFLQPYFRIVRENIEAVCPTLPSFAPEIPPYPAEIKNEPITYPATATQRQVVEIFNRSMDQRGKSYATFSAALDRHSKARSDAFSDLMGQMESCVCLTLTTDQNGKSQICPSSK